jgi:prolyl 4-hydroxylase
VSASAAAAETNVNMKIKPQLLNGDVINWIAIFLITRSSPTKLVQMLDKNATEAIYQEVSSHLTEWIPQATSFSRSSIYGVRVYTSGSILATHVDRDPLISSAIINVDQRVNVPWPLEVYDHEGMAHNLTLEPGEMILYESHSVLHGMIVNDTSFLYYFLCTLTHPNWLQMHLNEGRPFALQGEYYANIFVHFKPEFQIDAAEDQRVNDEL